MLTFLPLPRSLIFLESSEQILKRKMDEDPQYISPSKKMRIEEGWREYRASDGKMVTLPPSWIAMLENPEDPPDARNKFNHLKSDNQLGDQVHIPSLGLTPKEFEEYNSGFIITDQMLELWKEISAEQRFSFRRVLSGPMGVGKSYLSYFLAAKGYAEGWLTLYIPDAAILNESSDTKSAKALLRRFFAFNRDILTASDLESLLDFSEVIDCSIVAARAVFDLFKQKERKTLFIIDEHGELFQKEPYVPDKYPFLKHLMNLNLWQSHYKGSRVIFTGTAHAKYELQIMEDSARAILLYFVGPLSETVFSKWLEVHLNQPDIVQDIMRITNRVPREFMRLIRSIKERPLTRDSIDGYVAQRTSELRPVVQNYYKALSEISKEEFAKSLATVFLGNNSESGDFEWDFRDLGLIYRLNKNRGAINYVLCPPVQKALFKAFTSMPHHEHILRGVVLAEMSGDDFELALLVRFLTLTKPIVLEATNLVGEDPTQIIMDFKDHGTIHQNMTSLGRGYGHVLSHCHSSYPRFDFILDTMFIQVSISDFCDHEQKQTKQIQNAFDKRDSNGKNQIERYLDEVFGGNHSAIIDDGHFVVKKDGEPLTGFKIVYMRGSPGAANHTGLIRKYKDLLHVSFDELKEKLFRNIPT
ncbi:hypothetical protein BCR41DRAFT_46284 [Lobosporangium transversale]|uniref:P-loop containing nucleoside triphosphate hydrolase protein n=1 Tax=Lobosporangium transversale TaxID=64571 RepID=A0A1Y2GPZ6_9FUNG|nr:hypothetical protein BCR41DRAFT_46284 [Lobosporangium transversale]ORZ18369.1 hypothetical protein BCR41DRAFT_46284 [Lobosporangium transversale]|eukprot:XP_021882164.1 hypothetical protein BCR41DRAFT_46284 [Lobosporangium transversale]